jgi:hypothetical protein
MVQRNEACEGQQVHVILFSIVSKVKIDVKTERDDG